MDRKTILQMPEAVFTSHKKVKALPLKRSDYNLYRGWGQIPEENGEDEGFLVEYLDGGKPNDERHEGYISWTPKAQFEAGYTMDDNSAGDK